MDTRNDADTYTAVDAIDEVMEAVKTIRKWGDIKSDIIREMLLNIEDKGERHILASEMYLLEHPTTIAQLFPVSDISEALGLTVREFRDTVFPRTVDGVCWSDDCSATVSTRVSNKTEYKTWKRDRITPDRKHVVCSACWEKGAPERERLKQEQEERRRQWELENQREREERERLPSMPYKEYLQTEHWKEKRKGALKRAGYKCQLCNSDLMLQVHHRTYERRGSERAADLIVLCQRCHKDFHKIGDE